MAHRLSMISGLSAYTLDQPGSVPVAPILTRLVRAMPWNGEYTEAANGNSACAAVHGDCASDTDGVMACITGRPRWRLTGLSELAARHGHGAALIDAYRRHGRELLEQLRGNFSLVIIDRSRHFVLAAVDRLGRHPLYYAELPDGLILGSTANCILASPDLDADVSPQGLYNYVYFHMVPAPGTIYRGVHKLPAAHCLIRQDGHVSVDSYWVPEFAESDSTSESVLGDEMRRIIQSVVARGSDIPDSGAFLSGGLDSSTVSGMMARLRPGAARSYSIGFDAKGYDEMAYARIAAGHFGIDLHEYYVTPDDVVEMVPVIAAHYDEPFGNSSALPAYFCARMARADGIKCLLAGDGGDELFAGNDRYQKQGVFELYYRVPSLLRKAMLEPILGALPFQQGLIAKASSYVQQANMPLPDRLQSYNFLHRHEPAELFEDEFLSSVDIAEPLGLLREVYHRPNGASPLNRMLYLDWQFTLADNDLRKVSGMCSLAGIDVVYPLLDDDLVEFSTQVPSALKMTGKELRRFYKHAMRDFLPDAIINKSKHGFGLPFGVWMREHKPLRELAYDSLLKLKQRDYLRRDFIDKAIAMHQSEHAAYYGELVWILMMLELWLDAHGVG